MDNKSAFNSEHNEPSHHDGSNSNELSKNHRSLKKDGTFNIEVKGLPWFNSVDVFQKLIQMSWPKFILIVFTAYIFVNTIFALLYFFIGTEHLTNITETNEWHKFLGAFFFSSQSLTTVGYGRVAPLGIATSTVAALESMIGLLGFAIATGILYGRFSRPSAKLLHSKNILIGPHKNGTAMMFRIANIRESQLIDVDVQVTYKRLGLEDGNVVRQFIPLKLESHRLNMFPLSWILIHPITPESPLWGKHLKDFEEEDMEMLVYFKGYDETFSNSVHSRLSYKTDELIYGAKFIRNFEEIPGGPTIHFLNRINDYEMVQMPPLPNIDSK